VIVVDSSALVAILTGEERAAVVRPLADADPEWMVPEHFVLEVMSALRGVWLGGRLDQAGFESASRRLESLPLDMWPTQPLLSRIVDLTRNANPYDAAYVALAERLDAPLLTADQKLSRIPGVRCRFLPEPT
jgi:predicted nucleic acid-binding protein